MNAPFSRRWRPVEDLPEDWGEFASSDLQDALPAWREERKAMEDSFDLLTIAAMRGGDRIPAWLYLAEEPLTVKQILSFRGARYRKGSGDLVLADGSVLEACPAGEVAAEMDRLMAMHLAHESMEVPPEVEAAWLHHLLTRIRPFKTGNGRVARYVASHPFLRAGWLPLSIARDDRMHYLRALELADRGNLRALVRFFVLEQKRMIRWVREAQEISRWPFFQALKEWSESRVTDWMDSVERTCKEWGRPAAMGLLIQKMVKEVMTALLEQVRQDVKSRESCGNLFDEEPSDGPRRGLFRWVAEEAARRHGYSPNLNIHQAWTRLRFPGSDRADLLISYHGIGKTEEGVLGISAVFILWKKTGGRGKAQAQQIELLSDSVFRYHHEDDGDEALERFSDWIDQVVQRGIAVCRRSLKGP